jgi:HAD superfamily hydrolase (TIGR01484 family)
VALANQVLGVFRESDQTAVSFVDRSESDFDFLVERFPTGKELFDEYVALNRRYAVVDPGWTERPGDCAHFHLCAIGTRSAMLKFEAELKASFADRVRTFVQKSPRYSGTMCEVLHPDASKWSAILHLAERWSIAPREICAIGDDMNDVPMLQGAGLGVAMGHAPDAVLAVADHITGDHESDGLATFIEQVLLS